jgi:hypothetical protein
MNYEGKFTTTKSGSVLIDLPALKQIGNVLGISHKGYGEYVTDKPVDIPESSVAVKFRISRLYSPVISRKGIEAGLQDRVYEVDPITADLGTVSSESIQTSLETIGLSKLILTESIDFSTADLFSERIHRVGRSETRNPLIKEQLISEAKEIKRIGKKKTAFRFEDGSHLIFDEDAV